MLRRRFIGGLGWPMLAVVLLAQGLRWWCIATLGRQWNTRVVVVPDAQRVSSGPYRVVPHPNYVAVVAEGVGVTVGPLRVDHRVGVLDAQCGTAPDEDQGREPRAGKLDVIDLLVAGGGPAGLATALHGAQAGLSVVVVERRSGAIDKACGEGLMPHTVRQLDRVGVSPQGREFVGIRYVDGSREASASFRSGAGRGVRRIALHTALLDAVALAGVEVVHGDVGEVTQDWASVSAAGCGRDTWRRQTACTRRSGAHLAWRCRPAARADGESAGMSRSHRGPITSRCTGARGRRRT